jgi:hypothetical protein
MRALRIYRASAMALGLLAMLSSCKSTGVGEGASDSGDVRAQFNLAGPDGRRIRCQFQLIRADEGMKGGGQGRCQLASGKIIRADFSPS